MRLLREVGLTIFLVATCYGAPQQFKKKSTDGFKRGVETYSYSVPTERFDDNRGNVKSKVIVETIKSISPPEYLTSTGYLGSTNEPSTTSSGKIPVASVIYSAFEPDTTKKTEEVSFVSTETAAPAKKKSSYKYYTGSISSSSQKPTNSPVQISSVSTPIRTVNIEPATTLLPGYQHTSHSSNFQQPSASGETLGTEKPVKIITTRTKSGSNRYLVQKISKKPAKLEARISDSKPEETGFNGYHYDVGSLSFESKQNSGMMGASYMRSSSPFYNYHVMLD